MSVLVLYHAGCTDGAVAAWAAQRRYPDAELVAVSYQEPPPDVTGRDVLLVDFSYPRAVLLDMQAKAASLRVFDHHKTAAEDLKGLDFCAFDMQRSGAGLTWDLLHPGKPRPWLIDYVEDRDLWQWKLPDSQEVNAYLQVLPHDLEMFEAVCRGGRQQAAALGEVALLTRRSYINQVKQGAYRARLDGEAGTALAVNASAWANSEVVGELAMETPDGYAFSYIELAAGGYSYSLRASMAGVDVSAIAKRFGGGGHTAAAGFRVERLVHTRVNRTAY